MCALLLYAVSTNSQATQHASLHNKDYFTVRKGLFHFNQVIADHKTATVAFLGGSITYNPGWREKVCTYLKERFPEVQFRFINAGIPSLGSLPHAFRLQQDLLDSGKIDLLFVEAAVNDEANGTDSLTQVRSLEGIVRHTKDANPLTDIVLLSFADPAKSRDYDNLKIPVTVINHELVATRYQLASANLAKEMHDRIVNKEFSWEKDFIDLHPSPFGQQLYFNTIRSLLEAGFAKKYKPYNTSKLLPPLLDTARFENGRYLNVGTATRDSGWILYQDWMPTDSLPTREGFVHVPVLSTTTVNALLAFNFNGTAVGLAVISGPDAGIIEYSIDHGAYKKLDLFTNWSNMLHLPWYVLLGTNLTNETHLLQIRISKEKNKQSAGNACRIVHFLVNDQ